jgi:hypothetical protein
MVALKWLFLSALTTLSVLAQDEPVVDEAAAAAFWSVDIADGVDGTFTDKRSLVHAPRNDPPVVLKDPYKSYYCRAKYTLPPCATTCNRNNCFRGFLNARDGSEGKVGSNSSSSVTSSPSHMSPLSQHISQYHIYLHITPL